MTREIGEMPVMSRVTVDEAKHYQLHCESFGAGEPIIFMSGTACNCQIWKQFQVPAFSADYQVVLFDNRGAGKSDKPTEHYSIENCAHDLAVLMDKLKLGPAHLVGHSMGGRIALQAALDYPDKVNTITLAGSGPGNYSRRPGYPRGIPIDVCLEIVEKGYDAFYRDHYLEEFMFSPLFKEKEPKDFREFERLLLQDIPPLEHFLRHVVARQQFDVTERLADIKTPALVIVGEQDRATKAVGTGDHVHQAEALAKMLPMAELVIVKNSAHGIFWEQPTETNSALRRFFERNRSRRKTARVSEAT
jgi:pimeloyl-ACP methyl ester carboxylesterase